MPRSETVSTLHWPKNDILLFFKLLQKKVSRLDKRNFLHLLNESRVLPHDFANYNPKSYKKMWRNLFDYPRNFFLQKFEKWQNAIFGPMQCLDSLACGDLWPLMLKSLGVLGWFIPSKNSRKTFLVFWRTHLVDIFLSYLPVKPIWRNIAVLGVDSLMEN